MYGVPFKECSSFIVGCRGFRRKEKPERPDFFVNYGEGWCESTAIKASLKITNLGTSR